MSTKFALLNTRNNSVIRVITDPSLFDSDYFDTVSITDEQAALIDSGLQSQPLKVYLYENGELVSVAQKYAAQREQLKAKMSPVAAEKWIELQGFTALKVVALMDAESKLAAANKTSAKVTAVRQWLDGITAAYITNPTPRNDWPDAPFTFEQTMQEAGATVLDPVP